MKENQKRWNVAQESERNYWESEWKSTESQRTREIVKSYWNWYLDSLKKYVEINNESRVLEIGCGADGFIAYLDKGIKNALDPLMDFYVANFDMSKEVRWVKGVGEDIPFVAEWFDIIITTNALDHTRTPQEVLYEISRVLKRGGFLFLTVYCHTLFVKQYRIMKELVHLGDKGHPYSFRVRDVLNLIETAGLEMITAPFPGIGHQGGYVNNRLSYWEKLSTYRKAVNIVNTRGFGVLIDSVITKILSLLASKFMKEKGEADYCFIAYKPSDASN